VLRFSIHRPPSR